MKKNFNVIVVGAGPAGIGVMLALQRAGVDKMLLLEGNTVGASFLKWPKQMRLITPSFYGNPFFCTDLNAITPHTSPADYSQKEHISGSEYAEYLQAIVEHYQLNIQEKERVLKVIPDNEGYTVETTRATYRSQTVVWAGGEFSHPKAGSFTGHQLCTHSSQFRDWKDYPGTEALIIGGYESGIDAAYNLVKLGKRVTVVSSDTPWNLKHSDPSETLSPYTRERLLEAMESSPNQLILHEDSTVVRVEQSSDGYRLETASGSILNSKYPPISATGFHSALTPIKTLWEWEDSIPKFTQDDESTRHKGLYYSGPSLVHRDSKFCFIYKFRGRFGVIARSIAKRIGYPYTDMEEERHRGFLIDDLECCTECDCAVDSKNVSFESSSE